MATVNIFGEIDKSALERVQTACGDGDFVSLQVTSEGGDLSYALAIHDLLREHTSCGLDVVAIASGIVQSAAVVVLQGAESRRATRSTLFYVHEPLGGDAEANSAAGRVVRAVMEDRQVNYDEALSLGWLTAQQALDLRLIDEIT